MNGNALLGTATIVIVIICAFLAALLVGGGIDALAMWLFSK